MRVLWFTNTPSNAAEKLGVKVHGGGWISSLEKLITANNSISLGIVFYHEADTDQEFDIGSTRYYAIGIRNNNPVMRIASRYTGRWQNDEKLPSLLAAVQNFKPDVIHIFGSENAFGKIIPKTQVPVIIHIQGILTPYLDQWFPKGVSNTRILRLSPLMQSLRATGFYFDYKQLARRASREANIMASCGYFMGRTKWDAAVVKFMSPKAQYFHCEEVLRADFWQSGWSYRPHEKTIISTTINPNIYKGLDIILKTARLLTNQINFSFQWNIYGIHASNPVVLLFEKLMNTSFANYNVVFAGPLDAPALVQKLTDTSLFVHPSHIDNSPNSVCEAMLLGVPVIAANTGGVGSLIDDGEDGLLYPDADQYLLADAITRLAADTAKLQALSEKARLRAQLRHNNEAILARIIEIYHTVQKQHTL
jgi:glycosyltransferase involved in cell wall biosynthesis